MSKLYDVLTFFPQGKLLEKVAEQYEIPRADLFACFESPKGLTTTLWLREIALRCVFERINTKKRDNEATAFLESEIVKEIFQIAQDVKGKNPRARLSFLQDLDSVTKKAVAHIEANLFETFSLEDLAKVASTSLSTLQRKFQSDMKASPSHDLRQRRLEEGMVLLESGRYDVGEISAIVGYDNFSAFSQAFKKRFKKSPSAFKK